MRLFSWCALWVVLVLVGNPVGAQECATDTPSAFFGDSGTDPASVAMVQSIVSITDDVILTDTLATVEITSAFIGDVQMSLTAPSAVAVMLHAGGGGADDNLSVTYDDAGIPNDAPYDCMCNMQPSGPGVMADFNTFSSSGDWTLDIEDTFPTSGGGTLDMFCVEVIGDPISADTIRGDCLQDGVADLADVSYMFAVGFVPGTPLPQCIASCDVDGNLAINYLVESLALLNHLFTPGAPPPPPPYPDCGPIDLAGAFPDCDSFCTPIDPPVSPDQVLSVSSSQPEEGDSFTLTTTLDASQPVQAISFGVCHDDSVITLVDVTIQSLMPPLIAEPASAVVSMDATGFSYALVTSFFFTNNLPAGSHELTEASYTAAPGLAGASTEVCFCDTQGDPAVAIRVIDDPSVSDVPVTNCGTVDIQAGSVGTDFIRGDFDADGTFNGVVDGVGTLNFQFIPGSPAPPCMEAADADGDGTFNGVLDGLTILNHAFIPGFPPPADPYPNCGADPDLPGSLGCDAFPGCAAP